MMKLYGTILKGSYKCRFYFNGINPHPRHQNYGIAQEEL